MAKYELIPTTQLSESGAKLRSQVMPELVYLEDPALAVMTDFSQTTPQTIRADDTMDNALNVMRRKGVHLLLVIDDDKTIRGVIGSENILGEAPIQLIQERRIERDQVLVKMLMVPLENIVAFDLETVEHSRVGNIVKTLRDLQTHYALVVSSEGDNHQIVRGIFTTSQISKQLHMDIENSISKAQTLSELTKRHTKD